MHNVVNGTQNCEHILNSCFFTFRTQILIFFETIGSALPHRLYWDQNQINLGSKSDLIRTKIGCQDEFIFGICSNRSKFNTPSHCSFLGLHNLTCRQSFLNRMVMPEVMWLKEERMIKAFILTILLLYISIGCWIGDMELVAGGMIGLPLLFVFIKRW